MESRCRWLRPSGRGVADGLSAAASAMQTSSSAFIFILTLANAKDEPRLWPARRVLNYGLDSEVSSRNSFDSTRRDGHRRWLWRLVRRNAKVENIGVERHRLGLNDSGPLLVAGEAGLNYRGCSRPKWRTSERVARSSRMLDALRQHLDDFAHDDRMPGRTSKMSHDRGLARRVRPYDLDSVVSFRDS